MQAHAGPPHPAAEFRILNNFTEYALGLDPAVPDIVTPGTIRTVTVDLTVAPGNPLANPELFLRVVTSTP
ncbi:MAG: hypothetical protein WCK77_11905 [Verrucomicrobiota bacterium]